MEEHLTRLPLFPLPNVVHFPSTALELHIFEPRYRKLIADLQERAAGRFIGMVLMRAGGQLPGPFGPQVHDCGTAGELVRVQTLADGRSNVALRGRFRFRIRAEMDTPRPYREATIDRLPEGREWETSAEGARWRLEAAGILANLGTVAGEDLYRELAVQARQRSAVIPLVNSLAAHLDLPADAKQRLLDAEIGIRADRLLHILRNRLQVFRLLAPFRHLAAETENN